MFFLSTDGVTMQSENAPLEEEIPVFEVSNHFQLSYL